jgi:hypothetical protein
MDWDCSSYIPKNNLFSKKGASPEQEKTDALLVTEVNRTKLCEECCRKVGDVSSHYYEINEKTYCSNCGQKLAKSISQEPVPTL